MLTKVCQTSTTAPQTLCGQKSRGAAQAHLPARLQGLWGLRLFAATLLALAACASNDLEEANLSVDPSNQEGGLKSYTYKEFLKIVTRYYTGAIRHCLREDYPIYRSWKCWAPCNEGDYRIGLTCYKNKKDVKISNSSGGHCAGGKKKKCINKNGGKRCCSCNKDDEMFKNNKNGNTHIIGSFCHNGFYDITKKIKPYAVCPHINRTHCYFSPNCEYNDKLQKCTWKGGLIPELPAGTNYLCEVQKDTEDNIHCYDVKALENKPPKPNLLKPIQVGHRGSEICPPYAPVNYSNKCREQCYGDTDHLHGALCYQSRSPASSTDCTGKATFSFDGKNLCCPAGKLFKNGNCYINIYRINTQRALKPFCHTFNNSNCGITDKSNHCAWLNGKCVWNLPEYGYPSCGIERQAVICRPTETP